FHVTGVQTCALPICVVCVVDALYVPTDNTVVSALEAVVQVAEAARLPLVVGEPDSVARGGLITVGIDYYQLGRQTADIADRVLKIGRAACRGGRGIA